MHPPFFEGGAHSARYVILKKYHGVGNGGTVAIFGDGVGPRAREPSLARRGAMKTITKHYIDGAFVESHGRLQRVSAI
jgi:uncharacterized protein (DUF39 family)